MTIPLNPMPSDDRLFPNITPFTVRDNATFLIVLEDMRQYINTVLVPFVNANNNEIGEKVQELIDSWETQSAELIAQVNAIADQIGDSVTEAQAAQAAAEAARDLAEQFASQAQNIQDIAITTIFNDPESNFRQAADETFMVLTDLAPYAKTEDVETLVTPVSNDVDSLNSLTQEGRLAEPVMDGKYPAYTIWDGTTYPMPDEDAFYLAFGPVVPGLANEGVYWANPDLVTLPTVAASVLDESSDLYENIQTVTSRNYVNVPLTARSDQSLPFTEIGSTKLFGWELPKSSNGRLAGTVDIPFGWISARLRVFYIHLTGSGNVRFSRLAASYRTGATPRAANDISVTAVPSSAGQMSSYYIPGDIDLTQMTQVNVGIGRVSSSELDTLASSIYVVGARLEKVA